MVYDYAGSCKIFLDIVLDHIVLDFMEIESNATPGLEGFANLIFVSTS